MVFHAQRYVLPGMRSNKSDAPGAWKAIASGEAPVIWLTAGNGAYALVVGEVDQ